MIRFGTDGWRAKIAEDFTFENLQLVTQALVAYLKEKGLAQKGIAVGYDNRFQSEEFARSAAELCSGAGIKTLLPRHAITSPVLSFTVNKLDLAAGIMITASHNPPEWNGFKIKETFGGSALPETTKGVENLLQNSLTIKPSSTNIQTIEPDLDYLTKIKSLVDLELIKNSPLNIIIDPMHGSAAGYFKQFDLPVTEIRSKRDPLFGGVNPEPLPINLEESISFVKDSALGSPDKLTACIILDGDGDRLAAIDGSGQFINTHNIFALLLYHLVVHRSLSGDVVKTFNISNLVDKLCQKYKRKLHIIPIGFKHVANLMLTKEILLGGEESGGMGIKGFIPERDGILAGLMLLELMAKEQRTLKQILETLMQEHGYFFYDRIDIHTEKAKKIVENLKTKPPKKFAGKTINKVETLDGLKFNFDDEGWILFRASGTEPLLRVYVEARDPEELKILLGEGENLANR